MIDHVSIMVRDLEASARFYEAVLKTLGFAKLVTRPATVGFGKRYPEFWLNHRRNAATIPADHGAHVCLRARSREAVDEFHSAALAAGATSAGAPGLRPHDVLTYYAAFICDLDGNKIEAATFLPAE
jgi:catechol 2,3-dioxygenase-like lactoylglutathione lyase family enzyme